MDYQLNGIVLNHTLKSYTITPIERANVLKVTMKFYGGYKYKSPNIRIDNLRKQKFLDQFRMYPGLVPVPVSGPDPSSYSTKPFCSDSPSCHDICSPEGNQEAKGCNPLITRSTWWVVKLQRCMVKQKLEHTSRWVTDLLDQRAELKRNLKDGARS